jgi:hypothetical protein
VPRYEKDGVRFDYPAGWTVESDGTEGGGWAVTVSSPGSAFALITLRPDAAGPQDLAEQTLATLKQDYEEIDSIPSVDSLGGMPALGYDLDFLTLDTTVIGSIRAAMTTGGPLLVLWQVGEFDRDQHEPALRKLCASLTVAEEEGT